MYDFLGDTNFFEDKPVQQWGEAEFRAIYESVQRVFGTDIAWQLLFRLIQLRAGEIGEVEFNGTGNPLEAMSSHPSMPGGQDMSAFISGFMEEILDDDAVEELTDEEIEELFEDFEEDDFEDYDPDDDEGDDDDYRERYGNAGRFF